MTLILHITTPSQVLVGKQQGKYSCVSLEREGFIHACTPEQFMGVIERFFLGQEGLVLLFIDPEKVQSEIRWEAVLDHGIFPHIYGALNLDAVLQEVSLPRVVTEEFIAEFIPI